MTSEQKAHRQRELQAATEQTIANMKAIFDIDVEEAKPTVKEIEGEVFITRTYNFKRDGKVIATEKKTSPVPDPAAYVEEQKAAEERLEENTKSAEDAVVEKRKRTDKIKSDMAALAKDLKPYIKPQE